MTKCVLVLGAAGFLGGECVRQFRSNGYQVISADKVGNVDLLGDLTDPSYVAKLPNVDVVVNCAAVQYVTKHLPLVFRKRFFWANNVESAKNLVSRYYDSKAHFIHIGTSMMYQCRSDKTPLKPTSPMLGIGVYSKSKVEAQKHINQLPDAATVIPCIIGGKGRAGLFKGFVGLMKRFGVAIFPGSGTHLTHMVHVSDVAGLIVLIAKNKASGFFNAAAPNPLSIRQWVSSIQEVLSIKDIRMIRIPLLPLAILSWLSGYRFFAKEQLVMLKNAHILDISDSIVLGWKPRFSNDQIVMDIATYLDGVSSNKEL